MCCVLTNRKLTNQFLLVSICKICHYWYDVEPETLKKKMIRDGQKLQQDNGQFKRRPLADTDIFSFIGAPDAVEPLEGPSLADSLEGLEVLHLLGNLHSAGPLH